MTENIREAVKRHIYDSGAAEFAVQDGRSGVIFLDENEFIPFDDLGYNVNYGFFRQSALPNVASEYTNENAWIVHPVDNLHDGLRMFALVKNGEQATLIGEDWQLRDFYNALTAFYENGRIGESMSDDDEMLGYQWFTIAEACQEACRYNPVEYPYRTKKEQDLLRRRLQRNIQRGNLWGVKKDPQGRYKIKAMAFRGWLVKKAIE